jgi:hypothetical protein
MATPRKAPEDSADWVLSCPFLNDAPEFAAGFRLAEFWIHLRDARPEDVIEVVAKTGEEQFRVAATRAGYAIVDRQDADPGKSRKDNDWLVIRYIRTPRADAVDAERDQLNGDQ